MLSFPMPWMWCVCRIWLPTVTRDSYGNEVREYVDAPDIVTHCVYTPGDSTDDTASDIEDGRPEGAVERMTFFLPKSLHADLRGAMIAAYPADDPEVSGVKYDVVGNPRSYPRANTPGDYSWRVVGVRYLG